MVHKVSYSQATINPKLAFNIKLARAVEKHPNVYNFHLKDYTNRPKKQKAWKLIASEMRLTAIRCKEKWRNMRIAYTEYVRKYINDTPEKLTTRSYLTDVMKFLRPYIRTRDVTPQVVGSTSTEADTTDIPDCIKKNHPKIEDSVDIEIISDDESNVAGKTVDIPPNIEKEEVDISTVQEIPNPNCNETLPDLVIKSWGHTDVHCTESTDLFSTNPRYQFLMSILPDLEKMNDRQMRKFRSRVSTAIEEILEDE